jgi:hypothetical protein
MTSTSSTLLTQDLSSDILLLTAWLSGGQPGEGNYTRPHPNDNNALNLLTHVSNVLTIGHKGQPNAQNVNAVTATMDPEGIKCLIFAENCAPTVNVQQSAFAVARDDAGTAKHALDVAWDNGIHFSARKVSTEEQKNQRLREALDKAEQKALALKGPSGFEQKEFFPDPTRGSDLLDRKDNRSKRVKGIMHHYSFS